MTLLFFARIFHGSDPIFWREEKSAGLTGEPKAVQNLRRKYLHEEHLSLGTRLFFGSSSSHRTMMYKFLFLCQLEASEKSTSLRRAKIDP